MSQLNSILPLKKEYDIRIILKVLSLFRHSLLVPYCLNTLHGDCGLLSPKVRFWENTGRRPSLLSDEDDCRSCEAENSARVYLAGICASDTNILSSTL